MSNRAVVVEHSRPPRFIVAPPTPAGETTSQHVRGSTDRELWSPALAWYLLEAPAALGQRGTIAAVIAAAERGGASGSGSYDPHTDQQLVEVRKARRLAAQWRLLSERHQRVLVAYYAGESWRPTDDRGEPLTALDARFGQLAPVVAHIWCARQQKARESSGGKARAVLEKRAKEIRGAIEPLTETAAALDILRRRRSVRAWSWLWFTRCECAAVRERLAAMREELAGIERKLAAGPQTDLMALVSACLRGEHETLRKVAREAEGAVRRAHKAWAEAGRSESEAELVRELTEA